MGLIVPNPDFMRINTKSSHVFSMPKLSYTKSGARLFKTNFLVCPIRMVGAKLALHRLI